MSLYDKASIALIPSGYKATTLYSVMPANGNGDFTHSRSNTTSTRVNKDGLIENVGSNIPRLDYPLTNGLVGDCPHLLLEPSRTNTLQYTEDFGNSSWTRTNSTVSTNQVIAPDGSLTADRLIESTATGSHDIRQNETVTSGVQYTYSVFVKEYEAGSYRNVNFYVAGPNSVGTFSFSTGGFTGHSLDSARAINYGNGWYRLEITDTSVSTAFNVIILTQNGTTTNYTGDGSSGFYLWGAQLEQGSYATSYIPNLTTGNKTRSADACSDSGTSADINSEEGVLFVEMATFDQNDTSDRRIAISSGNTNYVIRLTYAVTANRLYAVVYSLGTVWATYTALSNAEDFNKVALKYKASDFDFYVNGVKVQQQSSGATFPANTMTEVAFDNGGGGNDFYGKIKQLIVFNEALSDSELETLTS